MSATLLAHVSSTGGGSEGGANFVLLVAGLGVVAAALGLRDRLPRFAASALLAVGVLGVLLGVVSRSGGRPDVTLTLTRPDPGSSVRPDQPIPVEVDVQGGKVARSPSDSGGHLHLAVDGALEQMPYGTKAEVRLPRGTHTLRVEYVDEKHKSYDPPIAVEVRLHAF